MDAESRRSTSWATGQGADYIPPSRVAKMASPNPSPRPPPGSTAEAVATARRSEFGSGGSILPVLTPSSSVNASKRGSWTTPRPPSDHNEDDFHESSSESFAPPPRRAEAASMAAARRSDSTRQRPSAALFASETEQSQLAYMEQMYGTINLLNAELEKERRTRAASETTAASRLAMYPLKQEYGAYEEDVNIPFGEFDEPPSGFLVSQTPVAPTYSPRKLRTMSPSQPQPPLTQHRVARPPVSPRSIVRDQDEDLCATLGKNAELRIRSRDMERTVERAELELELARKQIKMAERRAENREEKLRALLKEKLSWQKEFKSLRAQVVEEKMRQVDLFREVKAAKRHFAVELEAVEQDLRASQEENARLRSHANEMKAQMNFQSRKMEEIGRQAQDEKERFMVLIEDTRHRFREWKEGEAAALEAAHEQAVRNLKTEYELKMERHQDEKQKLRDKVNDLEVSMRLLQKDRTLSPLELSLRKTAILGSKESTCIIEAEHIETQSRILELENLLTHSEEYQSRQESMIKLSEATISRLMQEREVTALENLSLHPLGMELQRPRPEDLSYDSQLSAFMTSPSSPARRGTSPVTPPRSHLNNIKGSELPVVRSPKSRAHTPKRADLEASIANASLPLASNDEPQAALSVDDDASKQSPAKKDAEEPSVRELGLMDELARLRKELAEAQIKVDIMAQIKSNTSVVALVSVRDITTLKNVTGAAANDKAEFQATEVYHIKNAPEAEEKGCSDEDPGNTPASDSTHKESPSAPEEPVYPNVSEVRQSDIIVSSDVLAADENDTVRLSSADDMVNTAEIRTNLCTSDSYKVLDGITSDQCIEDAPTAQADAQCEACSEESKSNEDGMQEETNQLILNERVDAPATISHKSRGSDGHTCDQHEESFLDTELRVKYDVSEEQPEELLEGAQLNVPSSSTHSPSESKDEESTACVRITANENVAVEVDITDEGSTSEVILVNKGNILDDSRDDVSTGLLYVEVEVTKAEVPGLIVDIAKTNDVEEFAVGENGETSMELELMPMKGLQGLASPIEAEPNTDVNDPPLIVLERNGTVPESVLTERCDDSTEQERTYSSVAEETDLSVDEAAQSQDVIFHDGIKYISPEPPIQTIDSVGNDVVLAHENAVAPDDTSRLVEYSSSTVILSMPSETESIPAERTDVSPRPDIELNEDVQKAVAEVLESLIGSEGDIMQIVDEGNSENNATETFAGALPEPSDEPVVSGPEMLPNAGEDCTGERGTKIFSTNIADLTGSDVADTWVICTVDSTTIASESIDSVATAGEPKHPSLKESHFEIEESAPSSSPETLLDCVAESLLAIVECAALSLASSLQEGSDVLSPLEIQTTSESDSGCPDTIDVLAVPGADTDGVVTAVVAVDAATSTDPDVPIYFNQNGDGRKAVDVPDPVVSDDTIFDATSEKKHGNDKLFDNVPVIFCSTSSEDIAAESDTLLVQVTKAFAEAFMENVIWTLCANSARNGNNETVEIRSSSLLNEPKFSESVLDNLRAKDPILSISIGTFGDDQSELLRQLNPNERENNQKIRESNDNRCLIQNAPPVEGMEVETVAVTDKFLTEESCVTELVQPNGAINPSNDIPAIAPDNEDEPTVIKELNEVVESMISHAEGEAQVDNAEVTVLLSAEVSAAKEINLLRDFSPNETGCAVRVKRGSGDKPQEVAEEEPVDIALTIDAIAGIQGEEEANAVELTVSEIIVKIGMDEAVRGSTEAGESITSDASQAFSTNSLPIPTLDLPKNTDHGLIPSETQWNGEVDRNIGPVLEEVIAQVVVSCNLDSRLDTTDVEQNLWQAPVDTACAKEAVENSVKRRASRRRPSQRSEEEVNAVEIMVSEIIAKIGMDEAVRSSTEAGESITSDASQAFSTNSLPIPTLDLPKNTDHGLIPSETQWNGEVDHNIVPVLEEVIAQVVVSYNLVSRLDTTDVEQNATPLQKLEEDGSIQPASPLDSTHFAPKIHFGNQPSLIPNDENLASEPSLGVNTARECPPVKSTTDTPSETGTGARNCTPWNDNGTIYLIIREVVDIVDNCVRYEPTHNFSDAETYKYLELGHDDITPVFAGQPSDGHDSACEDILPTFDASILCEIFNPTIENTEMQLAEVKFDIDACCEVQKESTDDHRQSQSIDAISATEEDKGAVRIVVQDLRDTITNVNELNAVAPKADIHVGSVVEEPAETPSTTPSMNDIILVLLGDMVESVAIQINSTYAPQASVYVQPPETVKELEVQSVISDLCSLVERMQPKKHSRSGSCRCVHFAPDTKSEETDSNELSAVQATTDRVTQVRRSVLLWQAPVDTACAKEAVENSAKRRASRRRTSRRTIADLLAFPTELARFTSSDTTLLAYDARHEQGQPFSLLDYSILSINPNGRHIQLDDHDSCDSQAFGKRKTLMQELRSKNLAFRQIPRFNYLPVRIKFQWSDFVVATPVRPSNSDLSDGGLISKSPVEPMRLLQRKGDKLPCGSYVIVSAFIRPLEDGNENLRVQIYDAERVEEFQFDFSEDIMKKYHLESTGLETQSLEFLAHLEFRRDEDTIIIKLPEKKVHEVHKDADTERIKSERAMVGGGEIRRRELPPRQTKQYMYHHKRPASSPEMTTNIDDSSRSSSLEVEFSMASQSQEDDFLSGELENVEESTSVEEDNTISI